MAIWFPAVVLLALSGHAQCQLVNKLYGNSNHLIVQQDEKYIIQGDDESKFALCLICISMSRLDALGFSGTEKA